MNLKEKLIKLQATILSFVKKEEVIETELAIEEVVEEKVEVVETELVEEKVVETELVEEEVIVEEPVEEVNDEITLDMLMEELANLAEVVGGLITRVDAIEQPVEEEVVEEMKEEEEVEEEKIIDEEKEELKAELAELKEPVTQPIILNDEKAVSSSYASKLKSTIERQRKELGL